MFVHKDADRFGSVPGRGEDLEGYLAQGQPLPVVQGFDREANVGTSSIGDNRARPSRKLEMTPDEVGVDVSLDDPFDRQPLGAGFLEVNLDVRGADLPPRLYRWSRLPPGRTRGTGNLGNAGSGSRPHSPSTSRRPPANWVGARSGCKAWAIPSCRTSPWPDRWTPSPRL